MSNDEPVTVRPLTDTGHNSARRRFIANMRPARERAGLSQAALAEKMSELGWPFHQQTITRIEAGRRKLDLDEAIDLGRCLGTTVDALSRPAGLAREAWQVLDAARGVRNAATAAREAARRFQAERTRLDHALTRAAEHGDELADEMAVGRRALAIDLHAAVDSRRF